MHLFVAKIDDYDLIDLEKKLLPCLLPSDKKKYSSFISYKRKKEWLLVRYLLNSYIGTVKIIYKSNGQPSLVDRKNFISISHSKDYVIICLSTKPCAIDVDSVNRNYNKIIKKFLHREENIVFAKNNESLALAWCAKEAIYKLVSAENVSFAEHIRIFFKGSLQNFGYFYGQYLPLSIKIKLFYYRLNSNIILIARYAN